MQFKDYYAVMGLTPDAKPDAIKRAYRALARKYHPDVSKVADAEQRFKELGEAYEVLKDPDKRAAYDQLGASWRAGEDFRPPPGWTANAAGTAGRPGDFADFFSSLFGEAAPDPRHFRAAAARRRGEDHHARVEVSLEEAYGGATLSMQLQLPDIDARGYPVQRSRKLQVKVPRGVTAGKRIRLPAQGAPAVGQGRPGDLFLEVVIRPHRLFQAEGKHVLLTLPITPWEAALGAKVQVPTLGGAVDLSIPPAARSGQKLRLKGRGIPVPGEPPGDQIVSLQIVVPPADNPQKREFYEQMARDLAFDPRAHLGG